MQVQICATFASSKVVAEALEVWDTGACLIGFVVAVFKVDVEEARFSKWVVQIILFFAWLTFIVHFLFSKSETLESVDLTSSHFYSRRKRFAWRLIQFYKTENFKLCGLLDLQECLPWLDLGFLPQQRMDTLAALLEHCCQISVEWELETAQDFVGVAYGADIWHLTSERGRLMGNVCFWPYLQELTLRFSTSTAWTARAALAGDRGQLFFESEQAWAWWVW